ncbi:MAG: hypothetical protein R3253_06065, partial [Longimicrobiales bacterium]|nr:hypothetical protein [Longimicrobiales bacterium]
TEGQFEQELNAWDAQRFGAARTGTYDDLDDFWAQARAPTPDAIRSFRRWVARGPDILVGAIEAAARPEWA